MVRNIKIIMALVFLLVATPLVSAACVTEDINDVLKSRWPWQNGIGNYKVHKYPKSTWQILDKNRDYLTCSEGNRECLDSDNDGILLSTKPNWNAGILITLPKAISSQGYSMYRDQWNNLVWEAYEVRCKEINLEYTVKWQDNAWTVWQKSLSILPKDYQLTWKRFVELNKDKVPSKDLNFILPGDVLIIGEEKPNKNLPDVYEILLERSEITLSDQASVLSLQDKINIINKIVPFESANVDVTVQTLDSAVTEQATAIVEEIVEERKEKINNIPQLTFLYTEDENAITIAVWNLFILPKKITEVCEDKDLTKENLPEKIPEIIESILEESGHQKTSDEINLNVIDYAKKTVMGDRLCRCGDNCNLYMDLIEQHSIRIGIDPLLALALMMQENQCEPGDKNDISVGLMQIYPKVHCGKHGLPIDEEDCKQILLTDYNKNIEVGFTILQDSYNSYKDGKTFQGCTNRNIYYTGWEAALRGYNGWSCGRDKKGNLLTAQDYFVDEIMARYEELRQVSQILQNE